MAFQGRRTASFYEPIQDRIRIDVENAEGEAISIYLTRRITLGLAQSMAEKIGAVVAPSQTGAAAGQALAKSGARASSSAAAAGENATASPPKPIQPALPAILIAGIEYGETPKGYRLVFKELEQAVLQLVFTAAQLQQWLSILQALAQQARWKITDWPRLSAPISLPNGTNVTLH